MCMAGLPVAGGLSTGMTVELECNLRAEVLRYAQALQPSRGGMPELFDALRLGMSPDGALACNYSRTQLVSLTGPHILHSILQTILYCLLRSVLHVNCILDYIICCIIASFIALFDARFACTLES